MYSMGIFQAIICGKRVKIDGFVIFSAGGWVFSNARLIPCERFDIFRFSSKNTGTLADSNCMC
jgi:hypothetical protein